MNGYKQVTAQDRQSVVDFAIQEYGCYEGVFEVIKDNPNLQLSLHSVLLPGSKLLVQTPVPRLTATNRAVMEIYRQNKTQVVGNAAVEYDYQHLPKPDLPPLPPKFEPYVDDLYWGADLIKINLPQGNYADSIGIHLNNG